MNLDDTPLAEAARLTGIGEKIIKAVLRCRPGAA